MGEKGGGLRGTLITDCSAISLPPIKAFRLDLIWCVLHVVEKARLTSSKHKVRMVRRRATFSNVVEGFKYTKNQISFRWTKLNLTVIFPQHPPLSQELGSLCQTPFRWRKKLPQKAVPR